MNKPISDYQLPLDPHVGILPEYDHPIQEYGPATWGPEAYVKSFEKFYYAEGVDFFQLYPEACRWADAKLVQHFNFLDDSRVISIMATDKNTESSCAFPKSELYMSEQHYLDENGWGPYIREWRRIMKGARPDVLWTLFLKKEILKQKKIQEGDIRQIVCSDPIFARIGACFEQHQNELIKERTDTHAPQVGWCPFYGGFQQVMRRLAGKGRVFVEMDWTRYDGTIPTALFLHIKKLRWGFVNRPQRRKYQKVYEWYCEQLVHRYTLLPSGEVTLVNRGNPSGQISTTTDNCLVNYWLQCFEFFWFFGPDEEAFESFDTIVYGDDRLTAYPRLPDSYVGEVVRMYKEVFGMWVKPENVKVKHDLCGLSFCGFQVGKFYEPIVAHPLKLLAGLLTPTRRLRDLEALHGKLLSYQVLCFGLGEDHPVYRYLLRCLKRTARAVGPGLPARFTRAQLLGLWRGGPNSPGNNG